MKDALRDKPPMTPRDAYRAYLRGDLSPAQAEQAVQTWYASAFPPAKRQKPD